MQWLNLMCKICIKSMITYIHNDDFRKKKEKKRSSIVIRFEVSARVKKINTFESKMSNSGAGSF